MNDARRARGGGTDDHLVLVGKEDTLISLKAVKKKCDSNNKCKLFVIPDARHELLIEQKQIVSSVWEKIDNFLTVTH